jgi:hypothetical protein
MIPTIVLAEITFLYARHRIAIDLPRMLAHMASAAKCLVYPLDGAVVERPPTTLNIHNAIIVATALVFRDVLSERTAVVMKDADITALPVLRMLNEEFSDWQVILMTFDRVWFDLAREYTENSGRWKHLTLHELPAAPGQPGRPVVEPWADLLSRAEEHLRSGDLMAAAVYIRAAFETRVKNVCREHGIKVAYKPDPRDVRIDQLWEAIVERQRARERTEEVDFIDPGLMSDVESVRSVVLNRLSHSGTPTLTSSEVKMALGTVRRLQSHQFKRSSRPVA